MSVQIVISGNRVIAHGTGFSVTGNTVENESTGKVYDNATIATVESVPDDIDSVGYEYHAGVFVPCAPYGTGDNNGYFMEVCTSCATPRSTGIPIKGGLGLDNFQQSVVDALKWDSLAESVVDKETSQSTSLSNYAVSVTLPFSSDKVNYAEYRIIIKDATITNNQQAAGASLYIQLNDSGDYLFETQIKAGEQQTYTDTVIYRQFTERATQGAPTNIRLVFSSYGLLEFSGTFELQGRRV